MRVVQEAADHGSSDPSTDTVGGSPHVGAGASRLRVALTSAAFLALAAWLMWQAVDRLLNSAGGPVLPDLSQLYLLGSLPVAGLLLMQVLRRPERAGTAAVGRLLTRWSVVWLAATAVTVALTLARQANVEVWQLPTADNLLAVASSSTEVSAQVTVLWVSVLVAMFGSALRERVESASVLALVLAAVLATTKLGIPLAHQNHQAHPLYVTGGSVAVASGILWAGGLLVLLLHHRAVTADEPQAAARFALACDVLVPLAAAGVLLARVGGLQEWSELWTTTDGLAILTQALLVAVLAWVGVSHRRRVWGTPGSTPVRYGATWLGLVVLGSELVLAVVTVGAATISPATPLT